MSEQQTTAGSGENVGIPRPTRFVMVIQRAIDSYQDNPGRPGIQLAAWIANAINAYLNAYPDAPNDASGNGGAGEGVGAVRLTNLGAAVQDGLENWENSGKKQFGPSQANYVADAVIGWLQNTY